MINKILVMAAILVALGFAFFAFRGENGGNTQGKPVIKIGAIIPLTGDMANTGQSIKKGIEFAVADINKNPGNKFAYQAVFEDNQMQSKNTITAANKLAEFDKVSMLMSLYSGNAKIVAPVATKHKIVGFHGTYIKGGILDGVYNFENFSTLGQMEKGIAEFINSRNPGKIALVMQQTAAQQEMSKDLKSMLKGEVREFDNQQGQRDFHMLVYKLKEWNPDLVFISMDLPELDIFVKEMQRQQVGGVKLGLDLMNRTESFPSFEGFYILNLANGNAKFAERFGRPVTYYAPYFYDDAMIFYKAAEEIGGEVAPSAEEISAAIHKMGTYEGEAGSYRIAPDGQLDSPMILYKIENGRAEVVE